MDDRRATWIQWIRTELSADEVASELASLTPAERAALEDGGWSWRPGRALWRDPSGALRRARFTHWTCFETAKGELEIHSDGRVHPRPDGLG